ncbi:hypothetical protein BDZ97DRAFT_1754516 [Flammula alnicola]|nr:hypothetical protein BDZ97DRAFT_1754516 [Flammula alnicola]
MSRSTKAGRQLQLDQGWSSVLNVLELAVLNVLELAVLNVLELAVLNVLELAHLILEVLDTSCENLESLAGNAARDNKKQPKQPIVPRYPAAFSLPSRYRPRILATSNTRYLLVYLTAVLEYLQLLLSLYLLVYLTAVLEYLPAVLEYLLEYLPFTSLPSSNTFS